MHSTRAYCVSIFLLRAVPEIPAGIVDDEAAPVPRMATVAATKNVRAPDDFMAFLVELYVAGWNDASCRGGVLPAMTLVNFKIFR
jgi:hypothetical protein